MTDSESECGSPIPPVHERLGHLRPSRELLEYYRKKVADFDNEHEELLNKLEKYKASYEDQHRMEYELTQREQEIGDLQKAISDLQVCILQEREQVLRLYGENDRLRIREVGDRKRIQHLIAIAGPAAAESPRMRRIAHDKKQPEPRFIDDKQTLALQVEALQAQLEEQTKLAKDQVNALMEERRIVHEEADLAKERDRDRYERYAQRLRDTQGLLHESTQDILKLKQHHRSNEKKWMSEKDKLLRDMDALRDQLDAVKRPTETTGTQKAFSGHQGPQISSLALARACVSDYEAKQQLEAEINTLEQQLEQAAKLADMYREQCIQAEDELARIREENEVHRDIFKERTEKMAKRLEMMTTRYAALEKRRESEVEGFKTDVKNLRKRLKEVEKQLYKVTLAGPVSDVDVLQSVRATAGRSRAIQNELKTLKSKLYGLEGDLRGIY